VNDKGKGNETCFMFKFARPMKAAPGSYILFLRLPESKQISVGRLGRVHFPAGLYAYVGSALNGWEARVGRHYAGGTKRHWHIDCLRAEAQVEGAIVIESPQRLECKISEAIAATSKAIAPGFGSSDCLCLTHLHLLINEALVEQPGFAASIQSLSNTISELVETLGLNRHWAIYHLDSEYRRVTHVQSEY
jgi:Uri superfamily endonuclease